MKLPTTILPPRLRRHPWEMPWKMLVGLWAFRVAVFVILWQSHGGTALGASHSLTVQALFDVVAWLYRRQHTPAEVVASTGLEEGEQERVRRLERTGRAVNPPVPPRGRAPWTRRS